MTQRPHDWFVEHRVDFAARVLDAEDEATFQQHLPTCAECRAAVDDASAGLGWLSMGVTPIAPRPGLTTRIVRDVVPARRARWRTAVPWLAAASAALVLAGGWWRSARDLDALRRERTLLAERMAARDSAFMAVSDTLSVIRRASRVLHTAVRMGDVQGTLTILDDPVTHRWRVLVSGLPPAPAGERYAFWFVCEDGMVRGAEVLPQAVGGAQLTLGMPERGGRVMGAELTMEKVSTVSGPATTMTLAKVMLN
ncbi:MAG: anti-sigma factor [Gemmatimonadaceae bacterium]|jgi:hypothetical protein|nr:anti-sigma factor [Gemmatimonadaceae bacterium]